MEWEDDGDIVNPVKPPRAKAKVKAKSKPKALPAKADSLDSDESNIDSESDSEDLEDQGQTGGEAEEHGKRKCSGFCKKKHCGFPVEAERLHGVPRRREGRDGTGQGAESTGVVGRAEREGEE